MCNSFNILSNQFYSKNKNGDAGTNNKYLLGLPFAYFNIFLTRLFWIFWLGILEFEFFLIIILLWDLCLSLKKKLCRCAGYLLKIKILRHDNKKKKLKPLINI